MAVSTKTIWENFRNSLKQFIMRRVQNEDDAEDILQNVFLKIHNKIEDLKDESKLHSWIYQITRNAIIDYYRSRKDTVELPEIPQKPKDDPPSDASREISSCIKPMIDGLSEKYQEAIALTEIKGFTQKEIAENLGISLSGAKSRVQRARGKLKEELLACCHFEFDRRGSILTYKPKGKVCPCNTCDQPEN